MIFGKSKVQEVILKTIRALTQAVISPFPVLLRLNIVIRWYIEFAVKARETLMIFYITSHAWKLQKKNNGNKQTNKLKSSTITEVFQSPSLY